MPAIPIIGLGVSAYSAYKQGKAASKAAKAQEGIANKQSALAQELQSQGKGQFDAGQPALSKAMQHYMNLATGGRGAINSELAPEKGQAEESYRGAEQGINAQLAPGPSRDRAIAELYRSKASSFGMMPFMARQNAFKGLEGMGNAAMNRGVSLYGGSSSALGGASNSMQQAGENNANAWSAYGSVAANAGKAAQGAYDWYKNRQQRPQQGQPGWGVLL